jgi:spermidine synthase
MIPWERLDTVAVPGGGELRLMRRGTEFSIMLGTNELMNSRLSGSEEALATLSCAALSDVSEPRLLIGGLGMGFTLRAALATLPTDAAIEVAELVPAVVAWANGPMAAVFGGSLSDPRVAIRVDDVGRMIRSAIATYDAIMLDVDNGPEGLMRAGNDGLYTLAGLRATHRALRPNGIFAVWSSAPDPAFTERLGKAGFDAEANSVRAHRGRSGARHVVWIARRREPVNV